MADIFKVDWKLTTLEERTALVKKHGPLALPHAGGEGREPMPSSSSPALVGCAGDRQAHQDRGSDLLPAAALYELGGVRIQE
ncbi:MAG: hypothetical protein ABSE28_10455 [Candidatus Sulfotelmatobacter sp.]|jgi:hypothetical protein